MDTHAKLELVGGADPNTVIPEVISLSNEKMTIGRNTKVVDVVIDLTPTNTISRRHAQISRTRCVKEGDTFVIRDLASTNGVFVNGFKISEQTLQHGDVVQFGGAADIPVGTRFGGTGSHIRYRFIYEHNSRKRRQPTETGTDSPSPRQRPKTDAESSSPPMSGGTSGWLALSPIKRGAKLQRADTATAVEAPRSIATVTRRGIVGSGAMSTRQETEAGVDGKVAARKRGGGATSRGVPETTKGGGGSEAKSGKSIVATHKRGDGASSGEVPKTTKEKEASGAEADKPMLTRRKRGGGAKIENTPVVENFAGKEESKAGVGKPKAKGRKRLGRTIKGDAPVVVNSGSLEAEEGGTLKTGAGIKLRDTGHKRGGEACNGDALGVENSAPVGAEGGGASEAGGGIEKKVSGRKRMVETKNEDASVVVISESVGVEGSGVSEQVIEALCNAICGLCSELLLDARVLPCSHSFCELCWAAHVDEKGTTCPVCRRKFHSSERNPRRCFSLDLLIASLVDKLASPKERARWKARQEHVHKPMATGTVTAAASEAPVPSSTTIEEPLSSRGTPNAPITCDSPLKNAQRTAAAGSVRRLPPYPGNKEVAAGGATLGPRTRSNGRAGGQSSTSKALDGAVAAPAVALVKCEGCNEAGHDLRECPHRSESAVEASEDEDEEEEISDGEMYEDDADD